MPKRVARVLLAKVSPTAEGTGLLAKGAKGEPVLAESREDEGHPQRLRKLVDFGEQKRRRSKA
jgi:hypothetical protein